MNQGFTKFGTYTNFKKKIEKSIQKNLLHRTFPENRLVGIDTVHYFHLIIYKHGIWFVYIGIFEKIRSPLQWQYLDDVICNQKTISLNFEHKHFLVKAQSALLAVYFNWHRFPLSIKGWGRFCQYSFLLSLLLFDVHCPTILDCRSLVLLIST